MKTQINILRVYLIFCMTIFQNMIIIVSVMLCNTLIPMSLERHLLNLNNILNDEPYENEIEDYILIINIMMMSQLNH